MKENICTIPINDFFAKHTGCPFCTIQKMSEESNVEYITGAAMMEPSIRKLTNQKGFCKNHFNQMLSTKSKLSNALIMESHLQFILDNHINTHKPNKKALAELENLTVSCFVCDKISHDINHFLDTIFVSWKKDPEFISKYQSQEFICLEHYIKIIKYALEKNLSQNKYNDFFEATYNLTHNYLQSLKLDITHFCSMFDYRNSSEDFGNSKDSIERSIQFLSKF